MEEFGKYRHIITEICGGKKAELIVPKIISIMVCWAERGETNHTYDDLIKGLGKKQFSGIGYQLGFVDDVLKKLQMLTGEKLPTLNGLIRKSTSLPPSKGFSHVYESYDTFPKDKQVEIAYTKNQEAINYKQWQKVLCMLGIHPFENSMQIFPEEIDEHSVLYEGAVSKVAVNRYERNAEARSQCIALKGCKCSVCGLDFEKVYGEIGKGFIHIHHIKPISEIGKNYQIDQKKDLIPVCPNCHAMLHRNNPPYSIEELKEIMSNVSNV